MFLMWFVQFVIEMKFIDVKIRFCILSSLNFTPRSKKQNLKILEHSPLFLGKNWVGIWACDWRKPGLKQQH
jgi:hypothetical protein